jgi:hypothetical protein
MSLLPKRLLLSALCLTLLLSYTFLTREANPLTFALQKKNAYVFYATSDEYACSALVNIRRLKSLFHTPHDIYVLVNDAVSPEMLSLFKKLHVTIIHYVPPPLSPGGIKYYESCLLKLISFKLHQLVPRGKPPPSRILVLDADQLVLKSLDHVFSLPVVDVAAPRAYWISQNTISSTFMLITLSDRLWKRVENALESLEPGVYDMDLINDLFGDVVMVLPGQYVTLNSHWEDWNIPSWFRGSEAQKSLRESAPQSVHPPQLYQDLFFVLEETEVLHYTALGKPWNFPLETVQELRPAAHPLFYRQFDTWTREAQRLCPIY